MNWYIRVSERIILNCYRLIAGNMTETSITMHESPGLAANAQ